MIACTFYNLWAIQRGIKVKICHTGLMYRLIWVYAYDKGLIVSFVVRWLRCKFNETHILHWCFKTTLKSLLAKTEQSVRILMWCWPFLFLNTLCWMDTPEKFLHHFARGGTFERQEAAVLVSETFQKGLTLNRGSIYFSHFSLCSHKF